MLYDILKSRNEDWTIIKRDDWDILFAFESFLVDNNSDGMS